MLNPDPNLVELAMAIHESLHKFTIDQKDGEDCRFSDVFRDTLTKYGFSDKFCDIMSLLDQWTNDLGYWALSLFNIETQDWSANGWFINDERFEPYSMEYYNELHRLVELKYHEMKNP